MRRPAIITAASVTLLACAVTLAWGEQASTSTPRHVAAEGAVSDMIVVRATTQAAVIRVGNGPMETIAVGDFIGSTKAVVKEISSGRVALDEPFSDKDGKPNRALIIIKEGERGGTRYLQRSDEPPALDAKPIAPDMKSPYGAKPTPKKPPQL
jgi:hypothetical protein